MIDDSTFTTQPPDTTTLDQAAKGLAQTKQELLEKLKHNGFAALSEPGEKCGDCARFKVPNGGCPWSEEGILGSDSKACSEFYAKFTGKKKKEKILWLTCGFDDDKVFYESVFVENEPKFLFCKDDKFSVVDSMIVKGKKIYPRPWKNTNDNFKFILKRDEDLNQNVSYQQLFDDVYFLADWYVDTPSRDLKILWALFILLTYVQFKFEWLPYGGVVGDSETGKTVLAEFLAFLAYHGKVMDHVTCANIYQFYFDYKESPFAIPTFFEDEIQGLLKDVDKLKIYLSGNSRYGSTMRTFVGQFSRDTMYFSTFGFKVLLGRGELTDEEALLNRLIMSHASKGVPKGKWRHKKPEDFEKLRKLKLEILKWRIRTVNDTYETTGNDRLEDNLAPLLALAKGLNIESEFGLFCNSLKDTHENSKKESLEGSVVESVRRLLDTNIFHVEPVENTLFVTFGAIWDEFKIVVEGVDVPYHQEKTQTVAFGEVSKKQIANELKGIFNSTTRLMSIQKEKIRVRIFDVSTLLRVFTNYVEAEKLETFRKKIKLEMDAEVRRRIEHEGKTKQSEGESQKLPVTV
jgi:hypothetical protein